MANEITIAAGLTSSKDGLSGSKNVTKQADQTTAGHIGRKQTIPTSDTVITLTGVTTPRAVCIENLDAANYVKIGPTSGGAIIPVSRLQAGEALVIPLEPGVVLRAQANTASVDIAILIVET